MNRAIHLAVTHQRCPRRRMLEFDLLGSGIETVYLDPVKATRHYVRQGISRLVAGEEPEVVIRTIQTRLSDEYATRGIDPNLFLNPFDVYTEQVALVKAVLLGFCQPLELMRTQWEVIDGETVQKKEGGEFYSYVVRPVPTRDRETLVRDLHSLYTVAHGHVDRQGYGDKYGGLFLQYVVLGTRRDGEQHTPFITGYKQNVAGRMYPRRERKDPRTGKIVRLGTDFERFKVWGNRSPIELERWVQMLDEWGEFEALFPSVLVNPPQEAEGKEAWAEVGRLNGIIVPPVPMPQLLEQFPMHRHSCDSPTVCPYQHLDCCYGDIPFLDPTKGGIYRRKENHNVND